MSRPVARHQQGKPHLIHPVARHQQGKPFVILIKNLTIAHFVMIADPQPPCWCQPITQREHRGI